jgi:hypothetical protein
VELSAAPAVDRSRLEGLVARELERFASSNPRSRELFERGRGTLLGGVPMSWMAKWAGGFPLFLREASGARVVDVDGHEYVDFCLGDTGAMAGHAPPATVAAVAAQAARGVTAMLPSEDSIAAAEELTRRFGVRGWQFTLSATDANRFAIRLAREITQRPKILVFDYCYHGTVDETFATLDGDRVVARSGNVGPPVDVSLTTKVVQWNDADALERALAAGDVAGRGILLHDGPRRYFLVGTLVGIDAKRQSKIGHCQRRVLDRGAHQVRHLDVARPQRHAHRHEREQEKRRNQRSGEQQHLADVPDARFQRHSNADRTTAIGAAALPHRTPRGRVRTEAFAACRGRRAMAAAGEPIPCAGRRA